MTRTILRRLAPILTMACMLAAVSAAPVNAQTAAPSSAELAERTAHRRAVKAAIWGMPAVNYDLYFGPAAPEGQAARWIKTTRGKGWFAYIRIYGPEQAAFDRSWKPGDFEEIAPPSIGRALQ